MYLNQCSNEYHHLTIKFIDDYSYDPTKSYVRLKCKGKIIYRRAKARNGYTLYTYDINVYVAGRLKEYVLAELTTGDDIFVIGRTKNWKPYKSNTIRALTAECIYREDWLKFYNTGGTNPIDYEDVYDIDEVINCDEE